MAYSTIPKGSLYMNTKLYTGNGGTNAQTGVGFQPDFTWIKSRGLAYSHNLCDVVRGVTKIIKSNSSNEEETQSTSLTAFGTDGFTLGSYEEVNENNATYAAWNWKAGGSQGSSNTDGSINTTYTSVNTTAGFSISRYTGTGNTATVGHGLGAIPTMLIIKRITGAGSGQPWTVYTSGVGNESRLVLNTFASSEGDGSFFNNTSPTSSVFTIGSSSSVNSSGDDYICYAYADVKGYSKMGSYTGNGSADGPFVYTGFSPAFVMVKNATASGKWLMLDIKRNTYNPADKKLFADVSNAESTGNMMDLLSNGFKWRSSDSDHNATGDNNIFMAFAENPFVATSGSDAIPVTAR